MSNNDNEKKKYLEYLISQNPKSNSDLNDKSLGLDERLNLEIEKSNKRIFSFFDDKRMDSQMNILFRKKLLKNFYSLSPYYQRPNTFIKDYKQYQKAI